MKPLTLAFLIIIVGFISCKHANKSVGKETTPEITRDTTASTSKDSTEIRNTIMSFYDWYQANDKKFEAFTLYSSIKKKDNPPYKFNWDEAEKYLAFIHNSIPQLGSALLVNQRSFFKQCDSAFKVDVEDDIPYGFDYDWFTNSQEEPQVLIDELKSGRWITTIHGDDAHIIVKGSFSDNGKQTETDVISYDMKKENGKWTIARITP